MGTAFLPTSSILHANAVASNRVGNIIAVSIEMHEQPHAVVAAARTGRRPERNAAQQRSAISHGSPCSARDDLRFIEQAGAKRQGRRSLWGHTRRYLRVDIWSWGRALSNRRSNSPARWSSAATSSSALLNCGPCARSSNTCAIRTNAAKPRGSSCSNMTLATTSKRPLAAFAPYPVMAARQSMASDRPSR